MSADTMGETDLGVLEELDFEIPCGSEVHDSGLWHHEGPGYYLVLNHACPACGAVPTYGLGVVVLCRAFVDHWIWREGRCGACGHVGPMTEALTVVGTVADA